MQIENLSSTSFISSQSQISRLEDNKIDKNSLDTQSSEKYDETQESKSSSSREEYKDESNNIKEQLNASAYLSKAFLESI